MSKFSLSFCLSPDHSSSSGTLSFQPLRSQGPIPTAHVLPSPSSSKLSVPSAPLQPLEQLPATFSPRQPPGHERPPAGCAAGPPSPVLLARRSPPLLGDRHTAWTLTDPWSRCALRLPTGPSLFRWLSLWEPAQTLHQLWLY